MRDDQGPIKLAIVGCGLITESAHLPAALSSSAIEVVALVDPFVGRAHDLANKYAMDPRIADSMDAVLEDADAVLIATPNHTHFQLAMQALSEHKAVLVEKPLTNTYDEAVKLCEVAELNHTVLATGFVTRYRENVTLLKELLDAGVLGQVRSFTYQFGTAGGWAPRSGYNVPSGQRGGGVLVVSGSHFLDRMLSLFGWPEHFAYEDDSHGGIEANCRVTVSFSNGLGRFTGIIALSKTTTLTNRLTITTEQYECHLPEQDDVPLTLRRRDLPHVVQELSYGGRNWGDPFRLQLEDLAHAMRHGGQTRVDGRAGALCVRLVEEFYGRRVAMPEPWALASGRAD